MSTFCRQCGAPVDSQALFCSRCGTAVGEDSQHAAPNTVPPGVNGRAWQKPKILALAAFLLAVVIAAAIYLTRSTQGEPSDARSPEQVSPVNSASEPEMPRQETRPAPPGVETLTQERAATLILARLPRQTCNIEYRVGGRESDGTANDGARIFWTWLERNVVNSRDFRILGDGPGGSGNFNDRRVIIQDRQGYQTEIQTIFSQYYRFVRVTFCAFVPGSVNVLDRTFSEGGKVAQVIYTINFVHSDLTARLNSAGFNIQIAPPPAAQGRAILRRLDATGWQVESIQ
jgi:zinc-ribbon domain